MIEVKTQRSTIMPIATTKLSRTILVTRTKSDSTGTTATTSTTQSPTNNMPTTDTVNKPQSILQRRRQRSRSGESNHEGGSGNRTSGIVRNNKGSRPSRHNSTGSCLTRRNHHHRGSKRNSLELYSSGPTHYDLVLNELNLEDVSDMTWLVEDGPDPSKQEEELDEDDSICSMP